MKKGWIFAGLGLGLLGFGLYRYFTIQSKLLKDYSYKLASIRIKKFTLSEASIEFVIRFFNKSSIEATIKKLYLDILIEGKPVGFIEENKPFVLPANGSSDIPLTITFSPKLILSNVLEVVASGVKNKDLRFQFTGYADVHSGFIKKVIKIDYKDVISSYIGKK